VDQQGVLGLGAVLHEHLRPVAPDAAARVVQQLARAPDRLLDYPRIGEKLEAYEPREVRRIIVGNYELRYEIADATIFILRLWHSRENRNFEPGLSGESADGQPPTKATTTAAPGIVRPLAPLQTIEIACAEFCAATSKPSVAEQSTSPKRKLRRQPRENASKIGVPDVSGGHIAPV
jgi:plasmid stabilization system protein ParE